MPSLRDLRRTAAALVAVAMSAALIAFAFIISDSFRTQTQTSARVSVGDAAVVVQDGRGAKSTEKALDDDLLNRVSALDGVSSVRGAHWDMLWLDLPKQLSHSVGAQIAAQDVPALTKFTTLSSGRLPKTTGEVAIDDVCEALKSTFDAGEKALSNDLAQECANATGGYPFMIQLVGYQVWKHSGDGPVTQPAVAAGTTAARLRLGNLVHAPALRDLSDVDRTMLVCMAKDDGPSQIADIAERMDRPVNYVSVYRNRLLAAGIIKTAGYGKVDFAAPYLREYLREHAAHLVME